MPPTRTPYQNPRGVKQKVLNCLPCRKHKLKCDRHVPCSSCRRSHREDLCHQYPAPATAIHPEGQRAHTQSRTRNQQTGPSTPSSEHLPSPGRSQQSDYGHATAEAPTVPEAVYQSQPMDGVSNTRQPPIPRTHPLPSSRRAATRVSDIHMLQIYDKLAQREARPNTGQRAESITSMNTQLPVTPEFLTAQWSSSLGEQELFWKRQLCGLLPTQNQCDVLIYYYFENINWIFQSIHVPSFRKQSTQFWSMNIDEIDLIWLSLLYTIISVSAVYFPLEAAKAIGIPSSKIRSLAHVWHSASRQALHASGFETHPCITQLQTFSVTQLYWLAMNRVESLNSALAQAIRNAQALGLDKDVSVSTSLEKEMRHRIWWELCDSDTFQSMCLSRPPLIQARLSKVPIPLNCNDIDITETTIYSRPINEPTEMSMNFFRAKLFKIVNKLYLDDGAHVLSYDYVKSIDAEILALVDDFPWYFKIENGVANSISLPPDLDFISWQFHVLHTCICTQRMRMYRAFLHPRVGDSWAQCVKAAEDSFIVYRNIRDREGDEFTKSQKFLSQAYQVFSVGVAIAALLIVERTVSSPSLRDEIEMAISDLGALNTQDLTISLAADGIKVLTRMLLIYAQGASSPEEPEELVSGISTVFGGEQSARSYLNRYSTQQNHGSNGQPQPSRGAPRPAASIAQFAHTITSIDQPHDTFMTVTDSVQMEDNRYDPQLMDFATPLDILNWWPAELPENYFTT